jgi:hypothetical protein
MNRRSVLPVWLGLVALASFSPPTWAQQPYEEPRVAVAKVTSPAGTLLSRSAPGKDWQSSGAGDEVHSRDLLLALPGTRAELEPRPNSVRLTLWGNVPRLSSFPGLESVVVLHDSRAYDLDFTLDRGRVVIANKKAKGPATVWIRLPAGGWQVTLSEPEATVAIENYGRWPQGTSFNPDRKADGAPAEVVSVFVLKGTVAFKEGTIERPLSAPPGPCYFYWDSIAGPDPAPSRRDKLPAWFEPTGDAAAEARGIEKVAARFRDLLAKKSPEAALAEMLAGGNKNGYWIVWHFAVYGLAALEDLPRVVGALADPRSPEIREAAIVALRHWIGAAPGHDQELYRLLQRLGYSKGQAATVLQLLHSPFDRAQTETYETLNTYLGHGQLAIRELAHWHLVRLAPGASRTIPFNAAAPEAEREKAREAWRALIRAGKLPEPERKDR